MNGPLAARTRTQFTREQARWPCDGRPLAVAMTTTPMATKSDDADKRRRRECQFGPIRSSKSTEEKRIAHDTSKTAVPIKEPMIPPSRQRTTVDRPAQTDAET